MDFFWWIILGVFSIPIILGLLYLSAKMIAAGFVRGKAEAERSLEEENES